jgi:hypothetical protein
VPARCSSEFLFDSLKVIITAIVCLSPFIDNQTSPTCGVRRNAGRASGGALGQRLSVKQKKTTLCICDDIWKTARLRLTHYERKGEALLGWTVTVNDTWDRSYEPELKRMPPPGITTPAKMSTGLLAVGARECAAATHRRYSKHFE